MRRFFGGTALVALALAGCGGDGGGEGDLEAYCELVEETQSSTDLPSEEDLQRYRDAAPVEIRADVSTLVDAFQQVDDPEDLDQLLDALDAPEVAEAIERIEAFDARNCGDGDTTTSTTSADDGDDETTTTASVDDGDDEAGGTLCDAVTDEQVSDVLGVEVSSADTPFNNEDACNYESADGDVTVFVGHTDDLGQSASFFQQTAETNFDEYEEVDGIGESAYFVTSDPSRALAAVLDGGLVHTVIVDGDDDPGSHRDSLVELLELLVSS